MKWLIGWVLGVVHGARPNVLVIVADDLGWNDIGLHNSFLDTPNIDGLIGESLHLRNYYVNPIFTPTRSVLLSGRYQIHTGLQHSVIIAPEPYGMPLDDILLPEVLKNCGYKTHIVGKWHLLSDFQKQLNYDCFKMLIHKKSLKQNYDKKFSLFITDIWIFEQTGFYRKEFLPENRGFDSHYGYLVGAEGHFNHTECIAGYCGVDFRIDGKSTNSTFGKYNADLFAARVEQLVDEHAFEDTPLFLYAGLQNVHYPLEAPAEYVKKYEWIEDANRRHFAAMTAAMDVTVGRIVDAFKAKGVWDETIVLFTTDNGGSTLYGGNNWPLRGLKNTLWSGYDYKLIHTLQPFLFDSERIFRLGLF